VVIPAASPVPPASSRNIPTLLPAPAPTELQGCASLPMLSSSIHRTIVQLAWEQGIPVLEVSRLGNPETLEMLASFHPDVICVACFPWRLPKVLLEMPSLGCINVHPSLLPAYRGPAPGYWMLRNGERIAGVTIHLMDERLDTGDILLQAAFEIPAGMSAAALEQRSAVLGGPLLAQAVRALAAGTAIRIKQEESLATYYSWPN